MTGIFWYVSRPKIDALLPEFGPRGAGFFKELSLAIKSPFLEAKASVNPERSAYASADQVRNGLVSAGAVSDIDEAGRKPFFFFHGRAHRVVDSGAFFVVLLQERTAVLLAGSPGNTIGAPPKQSDDISPSADPLGSINRAFTHLTDSESHELANACSYVWATLASPARKNWDALPQVEGIAVFGAGLTPSRAQLRRQNFTAVDRLVVGSPIYVRQL